MTAAGQSVFRAAAAAARIPHRGARPSGSSGAGSLAGGGHSGAVIQDRLYRCGQFVLGSEPLPVPAHWPRVAIDGALALRAHPGLAVTQSTAGSRTLTLVGHMLDPYAPQAGNAEILHELGPQAASRAELVRATRRYGGRWLIIVGGEGESYLVHDALGLRQAFFARAADGHPCVASDAAVVARMAGATIDAQANAFLQSAAFRADAEAAWPADWTPYAAVRRLLPNHLLDLAGRRADRYWPRERLPRLAVEEAAVRAARLLRGIVQAAAQRFDLAVAVTAGIDSRTVLAACRDLGARPTYVTVQQWHQKDDPPDVAVAAAMLAELGLSHTVVRACATVDPRFARVFEASSATAHAHYLPDAAALYARFGRRKAALTGSGGEVGRCAFRRRLPLAERLPVTARYLARLGGYRTEPVAIESFARWLEGVDAGCGIHPLDLYMWEIDCGAWLATVEAEFDIAWAEILTPFNCRELLETMLAAAPSARKGARPALFEATIGALWPRLLDFPVNPHFEHARPGLYQALRRARQALWFRW